MIPFTAITRNTDGSWTFTWLDTTPPSPFYRVVLLGVLLGQVSGPTYTWSGNSFQDYPPPLEITLPGAQALSERFPSWFLIQWYAETGADEYSVQSVQGTTINTVHTTAEDGSTWVYSYQSPILEDETTYTYQVVASDKYGDSSPTRVYTRYMVTPPATPDGTWNLSYSKPNIILNPVGS